jgi:hypothetical protein
VLKGETRSQQKRQQRDAFSSQKKIDAEIKRAFARGPRRNLKEPLAVGVSRRKERNIDKNQPQNRKAAHDVESEHSLAVRCRSEMTGKRRRTFLHRGRLNGRAGVVNH